MEDGTLGQPSSEPGRRGLLLAAVGVRLPLQCHSLTPCRIPATHDKLATFSLRWCACAAFPFAERISRGGARLWGRLSIADEGGVPVQLLPSEGFSAQHRAAGESDNSRSESEASPGPHPHQRRYCAIRTRWEHRGEARTSACRVALCPTVSVPRSALRPRRPLPRFGFRRRQPPLPRRRDPSVEVYMRAQQHTIRLLNHRCTATVPRRPQPPPSPFPPRGSAPWRRRLSLVAWR